jgi:hypothetical protein
MTAGVLCLQHEGRRPARLARPQDSIEIEVPEASAGLQMTKERLVSVE